MTFSTNPDPTDRITLRVGEDLVEALDAEAERQGTDRSAVARDVLRSQLSDAGPRHDFPTPDDPELRDAYVKLVRNAEPRRSRDAPRIRKSVAIDLLYSTDVPKDRVIRRRIRPLERDDWVRIDPAMKDPWIVVNQPEDKR